MDVERLFGLVAVAPCTPAAVAGIGGVFSDPLEVVGDPGVNARISSSTTAYAPRNDTCTDGKDNFLVPQRHDQCGLFITY